MRICLVILIFGICWQNILARGLDTFVYSDHEERLQRLEALMFSQDENQVTSGHEQSLQRLEALMFSQEENQASLGHEENLQTLEAWISSQDDNKDSSAAQQKDIEESQEAEELNYIGEESENAVETSSEDILILQIMPLSLYDQILSVLSQNDNQDSRVVKA